MPELADIFRLHAPDYYKAHYDQMLPSHKRAVWDIIACRSGILGGRMYECDRCDHEQYAYHSCCNRNCPKCQHKLTEKWVQKRQEELLPATYFHVVFTLPKEFRNIAFSHQKILYDILIKSAAKALKKLAKDPRYIGGEIGIYTVLHTWTRAVLFHPHVHCLVPGGGISSDNEHWIPVKNNFLVPAKPLSIIFRAIFMKMVRKALPSIKFPQAVWKPNWVIGIRRSFQGPKKVLEYLGRYIHRIAITNRRILALEDGKVTFRYKNNKEKCWKTMTLSAIQFMYRYLQHVLPKGFHKVRYWGFLHPSNRYRLKKMQSHLTNETDQTTQSQTCQEKESTCGTHVTLPCPKC